MKKKIDVSIIMVNYNSLAEIRASIESVITKSSSDLIYEFIVVSNSLERDEEIELLNKTTPHLQYHQLDENVGFAKGNNYGINFASGEYFFFLNPDTLLMNDAITRLKNFLENNSDYGAVGPAIFNKKGRQVASVNNIPSFMSLLSQMIPFGNLLFPKKFVYGNYLVKSTSEVNVIQGSAIFIKKDIMKSVDNFTDSYFMYSEETDLCYKLKETGLKVGLLREAEVAHIGGVTTKPVFLEMEIEKHRSRKKFLNMHKPHLMWLNRVSGSIGYFWRTLLFSFTLNGKKIKQFGNIFIWYTFKYN